MTSSRTSRIRKALRSGAVLLSAGAVVAALNFVGVGTPDPGFSSPLSGERDSFPSRSLPDRIGSQAGITVADSDAPFLAMSEGAEAELVLDDDDRPVCISSPLQPGVFRISSSYGYRTNPITGGSGLHAGVDLAAAMGTPIHSVADGVVSYAGPGRAGRSSVLVIIDHEVDGVKFSSWYVHMYPHGVFVEADQQVRAGEKIAEVGSNGFSTGPHLHLEIHTPLDVKAGKGTSLVRSVSAVPDDSDPNVSDPDGSDPDEMPEAEGRASRMMTGRSAAPPQDDPESEEPGEPADPEEGEDGQPSEEQDVEGDDPAETPSDGTDTSDPSEEPESEEDEAEEDEEEVVDFEIEEIDDGGENSHTIDETVMQGTGIFDPGSLGMLHDPLPFLRALGYGLASPQACQNPDL